QLGSCTGSGVPERTILTTGGDDAWACAETHRSAAAPQQGERGRHPRPVYRPGGGGPGGGPGLAPGRDRVVHLAGGVGPVPVLRTVRLGAGAVHRTRDVPVPGSPPVLRAGARRD